MEFEFAPLWVMGVQTHLPLHRLVYFLNRDLNTKFTKSIVKDNPEEISSTYEIFNWENSIDASTWQITTNVFMVEKLNNLNEGLFKNESILEKKVLLKKKSKFNYLIHICEEYSQEWTQKMSLQLRTIKEILDHSPIYISNKKILELLQS